MDININKKIIEGRITATKSGNAYLTSDDLEEDVFIHKSNTNHSLHNDIVKVIIDDDFCTSSPEGEVIEIVKRHKTEFVGIIDIQEHFAFVRPDSRKMSVDFYLKKGTYKGVKQGEKVIVKMGAWKYTSNSPSARIIKRLGMPGENNTEVFSIMHEYDISNGFDKKVLKEIDKISHVVNNSETTKRKDFRNILTIAIDPVGARDRDDALSFRELDNGNIEVGVHIADVSHYVTKGSEIDKEAYNRGNSTYLVDRVIPMLPEKLSNDICSLDEGTDKLSFSFIFTFDKNNNIIDRWFGKGIVRLNEAMSYEKAQDMIDKNETTDIAQSIIKLNELSIILRSKRNIIEFDRVEIKFKLDENSKAIGVYVNKSIQTNKLIEEFMLLTNREVAEFIFNKNKPSIYRAHDEPDIDKIQELANFISEFGYKINVDSKDIKSELNKLLVDIKGTNESNLISTLIVRTMPKAKCTSDKLHSHYGLSMKHYSWVTSPIRRYADLITHRILSDVLDNGGYNN